MLLLCHLKSSNLSFVTSAIPTLPCLSSYKCALPGPFLFLLQLQLDWTSDASPVLDWGTTSDSRSHSGAWHGEAPLVKRFLQVNSGMLSEDWRALLSLPPSTSLSLFLFLPTTRLGFSSELLFCPHRRVCTASPKWAPSPSEILSCQVKYEMPS